MHDTYVAKPLIRRQIDQAFPVVQTIAPDLDVERWRDFAAAVLAVQELEFESGSTGRMEAAPHPRGIMTVQNARGYIHGLFSYTVEEHLRHGRVLAAENFIVLDLFDMAGAPGEVVDAISRVVGGGVCAGGGGGGWGCLWRRAPPPHPSPMIIPAFPITATGCLPASAKP